MNSDTFKRFLKRAVAKGYRLSVTDGNRSVILNYHSVQENWTHATLPADFRKQMQYLKKNFAVISLSDLVSHRISCETLPDKCAAITFDDGYDDNFIYAYPVLRELELPATIFVTTGFVNGQLDITQRYDTYRGLKALTWDQVREMHTNGIEFGAHTHTHPILTEISLADAEREIVTSKELLEKELGEPVTLFAYPLGQSRTFSQDIIRILKQHGFTSACSTIWGSDNRNSNLYALRRVRIDAHDSLDDFAAKVNGAWDFIGLIHKVMG